MSEIRVKLTFCLCILWYLPLELAPTRCHANSYYKYTAYLGVFVCLSSLPCHLSIHILACSVIGTQIKHFPYILILLFPPGDIL